MSDIFSIKDKVIVITGGSGFLGSQISAYFQNQGAQIIIFDKNGDEAIDITKPDEVKNRVDDVIGKYKQIDGLVHAAALDSIPNKSGQDLQFSSYEKYPIELWERELKINLTGAQIITQAVVPQMIKQKSGSIVFIASDLGLIGPQNSIYDKDKYKDIAYITGKAGVLGMMRSWAAYLGPYNVKVNALAPGGMLNGQPDSFIKKNSALNMFGRMADKNEYNGAVQFLLSDAASYMTGSCLIIDGGRTAW